MTMKQNVVFCWFPNESFETNHGDPIFHLGIGYLQAYLKTKGITSSQYMPRPGRSIDTIVDDIRLQGPLILGFTGYDPNYHYIKVIASAVKRYDPSILIVCGGPTATTNDQFIMDDCPAIDICVRGDGEFAIYEIFEVLSDASRHFSQIDGISIRKGEKIFRTAHRNLSFSAGRDGLDIYPSPYLEGCFGKNTSAGIITSRGCQFKCTYCAGRDMCYPTVRHHSVDRIVEEFKYIQGTGDINVHDNVFATKASRSKEMLGRLKKMGNDVGIICQVRADLIDKKTLRSMKEANIVEVGFGLESAVPEILRNVKKISPHVDKNDAPENRYLNSVRKKATYAKSIGMHVFINIISGLPGETYEDAMKTVRFAESLPIDYYNHNILQVFAGSTLFGESEKWDLNLTPSIYGLPLRVKHAFDTAKIRFGDLTLESHLNYQMNHEVASMFSGRVAERRPTSFWLNAEEFRPNFLSVSNPFLEFLSAIIIFSDAEDIPLVVENARELASAKIPTDKFLIMIRSRNHPQRYALRFMKDLDTPRKNIFVDSNDKQFAFTIMDFATYMQKGYVDTFPYDPGQVVFTFQRLEDVKAFQQNVGKQPSAKVADLIAGISANRGCFRNECMWLQRGCSLELLKRFFPAENRMFSLCNHGNPIATCGSITEIDNIIKRMQDEQSKKRGCNSCPVNEKCSRCLFPAPLTPEEYCHMRREMPTIEQFFNRLMFDREFL